MNELELLVRDYGVREVHFEDDNLTFDRARAKAIFEGMVERGLDLAWAAPNGLATYTLDGALLAAMKASGCYRLHLAVESGDPDVLRDIIHKPLRLEMVTEVVARPSGWGWLWMLSLSSDFRVRRWIRFGAHLPLRASWMWIVLVSLSPRRIRAPNWRLSVAPRDT